MINLLLKGFTMESRNCTNCPQCKEIISKQNRLIIESCGHKKCRQCFLDDEEDCLQCIRRNTAVEKSPTQKSTQKIRRSTRNVNPEIALKTETRKRKIAVVPSNINNSNDVGITMLPSKIQQHQTADGFVEYHCTVCDKRFSRTEQYYHLACVDEESKKYKCDICAKKFASRSHLNYHRESHESNIYNCTECGKVFKKLAVLRKHEKQHSAPSVQCTLCNKKFRHKESLETHLAKHRNELTYICEVCEKRFANKSALQQHALKHSDKRHQCNQCGQKFQRYSSLTLHRRRHSESENHSCSICKKVFKDANALLRHKDTHIGAMKYKCIECDLKSIRKDTIIRHVRSIHLHKNPKAYVEILNTIESQADVTLPSNVQLLEQRFSALSCEDISAKSDKPKTVENSSVIKFVGNVEPVIIPQQQSINRIQSNNNKSNNDNTNLTENIDKTEPQFTELVNVNMNTIMEPIVHKKLRKKYDPIEMYRKILNTADEVTQDGTNNTELVMAADDVLAPTAKPVAVQRQRSQSNFTETHWRKNFKYTYQSQDS